MAARWGECLPFLAWRNWGSLSNGNHNCAAAVDAVRDLRFERTSRRLRVLAWTGLPILGATYYLILVSTIPAFTRLALLELIYTTPIVLMVIWGLMARARSEGNERRFWAFLSAANFTLFLCEVLLVYWVAAISPAGPPRVSWPFHFLHLVAAISFIGSLISLTRYSEAAAVTKTRWLIDTALVGLVSSVLLLELYVRPVMGASAPVIHVLLGLGYTLFALLMAGGTLWNVVGFKVDAWRPWDKMFAVALIIYAVATFLWPTWYQTAVDTSRNYERGVLDLVQFSGHWLLMAAAVYRLTEVKVWELRALPPIDTDRWRWVSMLTPAIAFIGVPAAAYAAYRAVGDPRWLAIYLALFTAAAALALGRSLLVSIENRLLFSKSATDPLTGLANHRTFHQRLSEEFVRARRYGTPLAVVLIDIDGFADVNAQVGHEAADVLLQEVGTLIQQRCSRQCTAARLSADDFALIAPDKDPMEASVEARRILDLISIQSGGVPGTLTACAGVAGFPTHGDDLEAVLSAARSALRRAKQSGTDSLSVTSEP